MLEPLWQICANASGCAVVLTIDIGPRVKVASLVCVYRAQLAERLMIPSVNVYIVRLPVVFAHGEVAALAMQARYHAWDVLTVRNH